MTTTVITTIPTQEQLGDWVYALQSTMQSVRETGWMLADLLLEGIERFSNRWEVTTLYELASEATGLTPKTLQNMVSAARKFPPDQRVHELPISFHVDVIGLPEEHAQALLDQAAEQNWKRGRLRAAITPMRTNVPASGNESTLSVVPATPEPDPPAQLTLYVEASAKGAEQLAGTIARHFDITSQLTLLHLLTANVNHVLGRTVIALIDAETREDIVATL